MKYSLRFTKLLFIALTLFMVISCDGEDDNNNIIDGNRTTVTDFLAENAEYSLFLEALRLTDLDATLSGSGTFTVFAPTNTAFEAFLNGVALEDIAIETLTQLVSNHILNQTLDTEQLTFLDNGYVNTLALEDSSTANISMYVDTLTDIILNGQSTVTIPDIETDNGIIHAVNAVIEVPTITTFATTDPLLTSLFTALTDEGNTSFTDLFSNIDEDFTVFAPTNDAFTTFLNGMAIEDIDNDILSETLSNHIINQSVFVATTFTNSYVNTMASFDIDEPLSLYINTDNNIVLNGTSQIMVADVVAVNGVIHIVDTVVDLPNITTFLTADPNFSTLVTAATREASFTYLTDLQAPNGLGGSPFTSFIPTNEAFEDLLTDLELDALDDIPTALLASTLELHSIIGMNIREEDLTAIDGTSIPTFNGASVIIDATTPAIIDPSNESSTIITTNIQATNGVMYSINRVLRE